VATTNFDPWSADFVADPFAAYAALRENDPVSWYEPTGQWLVTRYVDVEAGLRNPLLGRSVEHRAVAWEATGRSRCPAHEEAFWRMQYSGLDEEPPRHTKVRSLLSRPFSGRKWINRRDDCAARTRALLEPVVAEGGGDLVSAVFLPLALELVSDALGIPEADRPTLADWTADITRVLVPNYDRAHIEPAVRAETEFRAYLANLLRERQKNPAGDLLSTLAAAEQAGEVTEQECLQAAEAIFVGPFHSSTGTNAIGWLSLLRHPDQLQLLRDDPELLGPAVEELLRYDTSLHTLERWALEDIEIGGVRIARGAEVVLLFASANRDAACFENPDRLDVRRSGFSHLAFGAGTHHCLGPAMGRAQMEGAYTALLRAAPGCRLVEEPQWAPGYNLRRPQQLLVEV
jgi:cytochrome P450